MPTDTVIHYTDRMMLWMKYFLEDPSREHSTKLIVTLMEIISKQDTEIGALKIRLEASEKEKKGPAQ